MGLQRRRCSNDYCVHNVLASRCFCNGGMSALTQEQFDEILKDLQVDKDSTNAAKRKLISAKDDRPSAQTIGYIGIIITGFLIFIYLSFFVS
ncbi:hypothetical protein KUTeg_024939 [Tegillarca granosa]|uniref:Uncharacterized protein n=1 Tax=Tegillarca granosa TaxID=220873 RepID=A0ABQ9E522_TEGGR|nr:hypothetical protein KUTeg_024939 [Tegillarca granosa]